MPCLPTQPPWVNSRPKGLRPVEGEARCRAAAGAELLAVPVRGLSEGSDNAGGYEVMLALNLAGEAAIPEKQIFVKNF